MEKQQPDQKLEQDLNPDKNSNLKILRELFSLKEMQREIPMGELLKDLPEEIQRDVLNSIDRLRGYGVSEDDIRKEALIRVEEIKASYIDKRFDCINQSYLRLEMVRLIDKITEGIIEKKQQNNFITINFDVNGLKAVNDLRGHQAGDEYLKRVAKVFKNGETTTKLKEFGLGVLFASCGGDEFSIVFSGDFTGLMESELSGLDKIKRAYQLEIGDIDFNDLIDFSDSIVKEKFLGIEIPDGFEFSGSVSVGFGEFDKVIASFVVDRKKTYQENLQALMGLIIDTADKKSQQDKDEYKKYLAESDDARENFLAIVLRRTEESMLMQQEIIRLKKENKELKERVE